MSAEIASSFTAAPTRVVIIGGGITGLALARKLQESTAKAVEVTLLEAADVLGGNLRGEIIPSKFGDFIVDHGPDSWVIAKPEATALCRELGLGDALIETTEANRGVFLVHQGELRPMPEGLALGIPTRVRSLLTTDLFSWKAKARMLLEPLVPKGKWGDDVSVGEFLERRIGIEPTETLVAPLLGGIFAGDAYEISLKTAFPQFLADEKNSSLVRAAMKRRKMLAGKKPSAFHSLRGGIRQLVDTLAASLTKTAVRTGARAVAVARSTDSDSQNKPRWTVSTDAGESFPADHVVFTGPSWSSKPLLDAIDATLPWEQFQFGSAATAFFAFPRSAVAHSLQGTGFIIPKREGRGILAGTWVSSKWAGRAPEGTVLMRAFLGGKGNGALVDESDEVLASTGLAELRTLLGISGEPIFSRVYRFKDASPNPRPGHLERVKALRTALGKHPGLHVAGNGYDGAGIPDCVRQANTVAAQILAG
jgi:oxygen-dependent protoporphyrinogen oxidase